MKTLLRRLSLAAAGFALALGVGVAIGNSPKVVETRATGEVTDVLYAKGFGGYTVDLYSAPGTDYTAVANSTNATGSTYAIQSFNGSSGRIGVASSGDNKFNARNTTAYSGYYISQVSLTVSGGTLNGTNANRSNVYFGSSPFSEPVANPPTGTATRSEEKSDPERTLTWNNEDTDCNYFLLYQMLGSGAALSKDEESALTITWSPKPVPTTISVSAAPTKTTYQEGDTFVPTGLVINRVYSDLSEKTFAYAKHETEFQFTPSLSTPLTGSDDSVTISYLGVTTTQSISVEASKTLSSISIKTAPDKTEYIAGELFDPDGLVITATYTDESTDDFDYGSYSANFSFSPSLETALTLQNTSIEVSYTHRDVTKTAVQVITVINPDIITPALTGVSSSSYADWSGKAGSSGSGASYAGNSNVSNSQIGIRTTNNNSGIVSTGSGGLLQKVRLNWGNSNTTGRTVMIYGRNEAYTDATDLYNNSKRGTLIGSLTYEVSSVLDVVGDYAYVGIASSDGTAYLNSVEIFWSPVIRLSASNVEVTKGDSNSSIAVTASNFGGTPTISVEEDSDSFSAAYNALTGKIDIAAGMTTCVDTPVTVTGSFINAKGTVSKSVILLVSIVEPRSFDSLVITTATSSTSFINGQAFAVADLVVTASFSNSTTLVFSAENENLGSLQYTIAEAEYSIGQALDVGVGEKTVVVSYTDPTTSTTRSASSYAIAIIAETVSSMSWTGTSTSHFQGIANHSQLTEATVNSWNVSATWTNGRVDSGLHFEDYTLKLGGVTIESLPYLWQESDNGKALTIEYNGCTKSNPYAKANIIAELNPIDEDGEIGEVVLDDLIADADIIAPGTQGESGSSASASNGVFTASTNGGYFTASKWYVYDGQRLTISSTKTMSSITFTFEIPYKGFDQDTYSGISSKTFEIESKAQTRITGIRITYLDTLVTHYANNNYVAQKAVIEFANFLNNTMAVDGVCGTSPANYGVHEDAALNEAWNDVKAKYNDLFGSGEDDLTGDNLAHAKKMLALATAKWDGSPDCLQRAMKTYDFVINHYSSALGSDYDFLSDAGRNPANRIQSPYVANESLNPAILVALLGGLSVALVGGYFFLRRRKEQE